MIPGVTILLLLLLPFLDRRQVWHPRRRPVAVSVAVSAIAIVLILTTLGALDTGPPEESGAPVDIVSSPIPATTPMLVSGLALYRENDCASCHQVNGVGGDRGPALPRPGVQRDAAWLEAHFLQPAAAD